MKTEIHPEYDHVVFRDAGAGAIFLTRSTAKSSKTIELDGVTYPVIDVELSSASHPFYTGKQKIVDTAGRVERFRRRAAKRQAESEESKPATEAKPAAAASSEAEAPQDA